MQLDSFEDAVNDVTDHDPAWWPFLWIRPDKHAPLTFARLVAMALLYGVPAGAAWTCVLALARPSLWAAAPPAVAGFATLFFVFAAAIVRPMWNRRADRLRARTPESRA
jgi:hypothetical protein